MGYSFIAYLISRTSTVRAISPINPALAASPAQSASSASLRKSSANCVALICFPSATASPPSASVMAWMVSWLVNCTASPFRFIGRLFGILRADFRLSPLRASWLVCPVGFAVPGFLYRLAGINVVPPADFKNVCVED